MVHGVNGTKCHALVLRAGDTCDTVNLKQYFQHLLNSHEDLTGTRCLQMAEFQGRQDLIDSLVPILDTFTETQRRTLYEKTVNSTVHMAIAQSSLRSGCHIDGAFAQVFQLQSHVRNEVVQTAWRQLREYLSKRVDTLLENSSFCDVVSWFGSKICPQELADFLCQYEPSCRIWDRAIRAQRLHAFLLPDQNEATRRAALRVLAQHGLPAVSKHMIEGHFLKEQHPHELKAEAAFAWLKLDDEQRRNDEQSGPRVGLPHVGSLRPPLTREKVEALTATVATQLPSSPNT